MMGTVRLPAEGVRDCAAGDLALPSPFPERPEAEADRGLSAASKSVFDMTLLCENEHAAPFEHPFPAPYLAAE